METEKMCLICREGDSEFLTRCNHVFHVECLKSWLRDGATECPCPLCRVPISTIQILEDLIAKRTTITAYMKTDGSNQKSTVASNFALWALKNNNTDLLIELFKNGVDLIISADKLGKLELIKTTIEQCIRINDDDCTDPTEKTAQLLQLELVDYVLTHKNISDAYSEAAKEGRLDIIKYFFKTKPTMYDGTKIIETALKNGHFEIVRFQLEFNENLYFDYYCNSSDPIPFFIKTGNIEIIKLLIEKHPRTFNDLIRYAIQYGNLEITKFMFELKIEKCIETFGDDYIIESAALFGHFQIVEYLLEKGVPCGDSVIDNAASSGHMELIKYLIEKGYSCTEFAINSALCHGHFEVVKYLIKLGKAYSPEIIKRTYEQEENFDMLKFFIENGHVCEPDVLDFLASKGFSDIVKYLIVKGTNYAIDQAAYKGYVEIVKCLVEGGRSCSPWAINRAAERGHYEIVKILVEAGKSCTHDAIDDAAQKGHYEIVKLLVDARKKCSTNAIDDAAHGGYLEIVKLLVEKRARCTNSAIRSAATNGHLEIVKCLVESGKSCTSDAIDSAVSSKHTDVVKYLLEKGKPCTEKAYTEAAKNGSLDIIMLLFEHDKPCCANAIASAASGGHFNIVKYLIAMKQTFKFNAISAAANSERLDIVKYLIKNEGRLENNESAKRAKQENV